MKNLLKTFGIILIIAFFDSCEDKPTPPVLSTNSITDISTTSAISGGNITDGGGAPIISKGICWNTSDNPTIVNNKTTENGESLSFSGNITQLIPGTSYFVRAYATNSAGTSYGKSVSFKTLGDKPGSNSQSASNLQLTAATLNGTVNPNSLETIVTFEYGTTTSYGSTAIAQQSPLSGDSDGNVSVDLTGLAIGTTYHFRIKAENSLGTTYSSDLTFTTLGAVPTTITPTATNLQVKSVRLNGSVNPNYISSTVTFEWGATLNFGNSITATPSTLTGSDPVSISADLSGLLPGTTYYARIKAENSLGTSFSGNISFTTQEFEWLESTDFPGEARRYPLSFTYNGKGYYGLGKNSIYGENLHDFWSFDPSNSTWTRLNDCPFTFQSGLTSNCLVGSSIYVFKEWALYSYNIDLDTWEFLCNTSVSLFRVSGFSINDKPYFYIKSSSELYEYNPVNKTLENKNALINDYLDWWLNETFVINNEAYLIHKNNTKVEIYHYISQSNTWEKKLEKEFSNREFNEASFIVTIDNNAFIGQSTSFEQSAPVENATVTAVMPSSRVWKYDPLNNEFKQCPDLPGVFRAQSGCFSFENTGYVIGGVTVDENTQKFKYLKDIVIMNR